MRPTPVLIAGLVAAGLGAILWGVIGYYLHLEIGWIAIIIGSVVGLVCAAAARDEAGVESGAIAAGLTVAAIVCGKLAMAYAFTHRYSDRDYALSAIAAQIVYEHSREGKSYRFPKDVSPSEAVGRDEHPAELWQQAETRWSALSSQEQSDLLAFPDLANPEYMTSLVADEVVEEWRDAGRQLRWPGGVEPDYPERASDYPADVWKEALSRWEALSDSERRARIDDEVAYRESVLKDFQSSAFWIVFKSTWGVLDSVFVGVGLLAAFKLGGGLTSG